MPFIAVLFLLTALVLVFAWESVSEYRSTRGDTGTKIRNVFRLHAPYYVAIAGLFVLAIVKETPVQIAMSVLIVGIVLIQAVVEANRIRARKARADSAQSLN